MNSLLSILRIGSSLIVFVALVIVLPQGCTDVVDIDLEPADEQLVIDAWLNDKSETQTIRLTLSQPYFENVFAPGVDDAEIVLTRQDGQQLHFESQANGNYTWTPDTGAQIGGVGDKFTLSILWDGETYSGESEIRRVPVIDSISIELRQDELGFADGHWAILFARDFQGLGDTYWIKAYKNGVFLNKPSEMNLAYDAAFDAGGEIDGITFITPIRELINRFPDPDTEDDFEIPPYAPGDVVHVEIHAITNEAFRFLQTARDQMNNGDNTIFSIPVANTTSNIRRESDGKAALGFFCVSAVSEATRVVQ